MRNMQYSAGITLFFPSNNELEALLSYAPVFDKIYVYDNTDSIDEQISNSEFFANTEKFEYFSDCKNFGLSVAFNSMCKTATLNNSDYICLLDQDSIISNSSLIKMMSHINSAEDNSVGIYTPEIIYRSDLRNPASARSRKTENQELNWAITSGSFIHLDTFNLTEGFDENYFIDRLDYDYCLQIRELGYKIIRIKNTFLFQQLGSKTRFLGISVSEHNALRHYYVFRNRLYFYHSKHFSYLNMLIVTLLSIRHVFSIIAESNSLEKLLILRRSMVDYSASKMGKFGN